MALDRALTLRNAEKLIRQGKLADGIAEYVRIVEDAPGDWNAKNTLGDLYARAGQTDKAIEQFVEIADNLGEEGSTAKAGAVFKKILKLKPDHEKALTEVADILGAQRLYADARECATTVEQFRMLAASIQAQGNADDALETLRQAARLNPLDTELRAELARTFVARGDTATAAEYLTLETAGGDPDLLMTVAD